MFSADNISPVCERAKKPLADAIQLFESGMPEPAVNRLRVALEAMLDDYLRQPPVRKYDECIQYAAQNDPNFNMQAPDIKLLHMIKFLSQDSISDFSRSTIDNMHFIRKKGNYGSHNNDDAPTSEDVELGLHYISRIALALQTARDNYVSYLAKRMCEPAQLPTNLNAMELYEQVSPWLPNNLDTWASRSMEAYTQMIKLFCQGAYVLSIHQAKEAIDSLLYNFISFRMHLSGEYSKYLKSPTTRSANALGFLLSDSTIPPGSPACLREFICDCEKTLDPKLASFLGGWPNLKSLVSFIQNSSAQALAAASGMCPAEANSDPPDITAQKALAAFAAAYKILEKTFYVCLDARSATKPAQLVTPAFSDESVNNNPSSGSSNKPPVSNDEHAGKPVANSNSHVSNQHEPDSSPPATSKKRSFLYRLFNNYWPFFLCVLCVLFLLNYFAPGARVVRYIDRHEDVAVEDVEQYFWEIKYGLQGKIFMRLADRSLQRHTRRVLSGHESGEIAYRQLGVLEEACERVADHGDFRLRDNAQRIAAMRAKMSVFNQAVNAEQSGQFVSAIQTYLQLQSFEDFWPAAEKRIAAIRPNAAQEIYAQLKALDESSSTADWISLYTDILHMRSYSSEKDFAAWKLQYAEKLDARCRSLSCSSITEWDEWLDCVSNARLMLKLADIHDFSEANEILTNTYAGFAERTVHTMLEKHELLEAQQFVRHAQIKFPKSEKITDIAAAVSSVGFEFLDVVDPSVLSELHAASTTLVDGAGGKHGGAHTLRRSVSGHFTAQVAVQLDGSFSYLHGTLFVCEDTTSSDGTYNVHIFSSQDLSDEHCIYNSGPLSKDSCVAVNVPLDGLGEIVIVLENNGSWAETAIIILEDFILIR